MIVINYNNVCEYVDVAIAKGVKTDLAVIERLLDFLGNPHHKMNVIHITGTNGKGSTAAFVSSILTAMRYKVGLFTSPHLSDFRERVQIGNKKINKSNVCELISKIKTASEKLEIVPSFFELMLILGVMYFRQQNCDFVVAEVGIGGRLDSTNVFFGRVCAITGIDFDHMELLGATKLDIAREKAAIVKPGSVMIANVKERGLFEFIERESMARNVHEVVNVDSVVKGVMTSMDTSGIDFTIDSPSFSFKKFHSRLTGDYQLENIKTAICIIESLKKLKLIEIDQAAVKNGIEKTFWPGRFEIIKYEGHDYLLDGAHNVNGIEALSRNLKSMFKGRKVRSIISIISSKQYDAMLKIVSEISSEIIIVGIKNTKKKVDSAALLKYASEFCPASSFFENFSEALDYLKASISDELVCITGSLYLVGEARNVLMNSIANRELERS